MALALLLTLALAACAKQEPDVPAAQPQSGVYSPNAYYEYLIGSTVWQLSAESQAMMRQTFSAASGELLKMRERCESGGDPDWAYAADDTGRQVMTYQGKPVAVICDIDDTLVDGAHYTANIVGSNGDMNNAAFARFVMSDGCTALPGAVAFIQLCVDSGAEVFYITNRYDQGYRIGQSDSMGGYPEAGGGLYLAADGTEIGTTTYQVFGKSFYDITLASMTRLGFPIDERHLIMNDSKLYGASKQKARDAVANGTDAYPTGQRADGNATGSALTLSCAAHHIALLLGDQLTDFTDDFSDPGLNAVSRAALTEQYASYFGTTWFLLPNAVYGSAMEAAGAYGLPELLHAYDYTEQ